MGMIGLGTGHSISNKKDIAPKITFPYVTANPDAIDNAGDAFQDFDYAGGVDKPIFIKMTVAESRFYSDHLIDVFERVSISLEKAMKGDPYISILPNHITKYINVTDENLISKNENDFIVVIKAPHDNSKQTKEGNLPFTIVESQAAVFSFMCELNKELRLQESFHSEDAPFHGVYINDIDALVEKAVIAENKRKVTDISDEFRAEANAIMAIPYDGDREPKRKAFFKRILEHGKEALPYLEELRETELSPSYSSEHRVFHEDTMTTAETIYKANKDDIEVENAFVRILENTGNHWFKQQNMKKAMVATLPVERQKQFNL